MHLIELFLKHAKLVYNKIRSCLFCKILISSVSAGLCFGISSLFVLSDYQKIFPFHVMIFFSYLGLLFFLRKYFVLFQIEFFHKLVAITVVLYFPLRIFIDTLTISFLPYPQNLFEMISVAYLFICLVLWLQKLGHFFEKPYYQMLFVAVFTPILIYLLSPPSGVHSDIMWQGKYGLVISPEGVVPLNKGIQQLNEEFKDFP